MAKTTNTETPAARVKGKQVGTTVSPEYFEALDEYRWSVRKTMPELVKTALDEYAANHGVNVPSDAPAADAPEGENPEA